MQAHMGGLNTYLKSFRADSIEKRKAIIITNAINALHMNINFAYFFLSPSILNFHIAEIYLFSRACVCVDAKCEVLKKDSFWPAMQLKYSVHDKPIYMQSVEHILMQFKYI